MEAIRAAAPARGGKKHKPGHGFSANNTFPGEEGSEIETEQISAVDYEYGEQREDEEENNEQQDILVEDDLNNNRIEYKSGVQEWPDGSCYKGEFSFDLKLGYGEFAWDSGERYIGQFYKDYRHGKGVYFWPNGSRFTGSFYLNRKEGYGTMEFMDGKQFQGLYKADERFGPGVETYPDGRQEVGLWHRNHIIKLCTDIPEHFTLFDFPELSIYSDAESKEQYISEESTSIWDLNEEKDPFFYRFKQLILNDDNYTLPANMHIYSIDADNLPLTQSFLKEFDFQYFKKRKHHSSEKPWCITNITPILVKVQKNIYKYRHCQSDIDWNINAIIKGNRHGFGAKGPKELIAEELIKKSAEGNYKRVSEILRENLAHPDIADVTGYTALSAAALNYQEDIINLLLDCGADVNKCSDEGLSALSMCVIHYFPAEGFQPNIAERNIFSKELEDILDEMSKESITFSRSEVSQLSEASTNTTTPASVEALSFSVEKTEFVPDVEIKSSAETDNGEKCSGTICGIYNYKLTISPETMHQGAAVLSQHMLQTHGYPDTRDSVPQDGTLSRMAASLTEQKKRMSIIKVLLRRGADPNISNIPMHVLFFAVKSGDTESVRILLEAGARTDIRLPTRLGGVAPLHIAAALPGVEGIVITELLLHAAADPDVRAEDENDKFRLDKILTKFDIGESVSFMKMNNEIGPPKWYYRECTIVPEEGGRTPLHIACEREDNFLNTRKVINYLLDHNANPNVLWNGHSPLSLAVANGNEQAVAELLAGGADPNLPLSQSVASALCAVINPAYEQGATLAAKTGLINTLIAAGADMLLPITLVSDDNRSAVGTVVDYAYFKYYQDKRLLHIPLHSLSPVERETYAFRRKMLDFLSERLRECVSEKEKKWDEEELRKIKIASAGIRRKSLSTNLGLLPETDSSKLLFFKYCYQCGRSVGVTLTPCPHCFEIFTCSKSCKVKAWNERHKRECLQTVRQRKPSIKPKVTVQYPKSKDIKAKQQAAAAARHQKEDVEKWKHDRRRRTPVQASSKADLPYTGNYSFI